MFILRFDVLLVLELGHSRVYSYNRVIKIANIFSGRLNEQDAF